MSDSLGVIRIKQLPEKTELALQDFMVIEDTNDTWKVKVQHFNKYIEDAVGDIKDDIGGDLEDKLSEIQIIVNNITEITNNLADKVGDFETEEAKRIKNEKGREAAEIIRNNNYDDMVASENLRSIAEAIRKSNDEAYTVNEAARKANEELRKTANATYATNETNRGVAEGKRVTEETTRKSNEVTRVSNETNRVNNFTTIQSYFDSLRAKFDRYCKEGISKATTSANMVVKLIEISIPTNSTSPYEALLHLSTVGTNEGFLGVEISLVKNTGGVVTGVKGSLSFPERYKFFNIGNFNMYSTIAGDQVLVSLEYKVVPTNSIIKVGISWDNITTFKHLSVPIYSQAIRDFVPKPSFNNTGVISIAKTIGYSCPQGFINILDEIEQQMIDIVENIKPIKSYPIGSLYRTTSTKNPSVLLGGGVWILLYDTGIKENIIVNGTNTYSPVVYEWERQS